MSRTCPLPRPCPLPPAPTPEPRRPLPVVFLAVPLVGLPRVVVAAASGPNRSVTWREQAQRGLKPRVTGAAEIPRRRHCHDHRTVLYSPHVRSCYSRRSVACPPLPSLPTEYFLRCLKRATLGTTKTRYEFIESAQFSLTKRKEERKKHT